MKAISIRQPWAWLVVNGHKDIENRTWATKYRGKILVHAGVHRVTKAEYDAFANRCRRMRIMEFPPIDGFKTGGIVGIVEFVGCIKKSKSPWFTGPWGFVLSNGRERPFEPMKGKLGLFNTQEIAD